METVLLKDDGRDSSGERVVVEDDGGYLGGE